MTKKEALAQVMDWLGACVSCAEADGYQEHEGEPWSGEDGEPQLFSNSSSLIIRHRGWEFTATLRGRRIND